LGMNLEDIDGIDTIAGYVLSKLSSEPTEGQEFDINETYKVKIIEVDGLRIKYLLFTKKESLH
jgi:CBS domain containing-hemolysin-like protein